MGKTDDKGKPVTEDNPEAPCEVCGKAAILHDGDNIAHIYIPPGQQPQLRKVPRPEANKGQAETRAVQGPPPDLVLRSLLLRKGLITVEELEAEDRAVKALKLSGS